jgi:hypothetical protein
MKYIVRIFSDDPQDPPQLEQVEFDEADTDYLEDCGLRGWFELKEQGNPHTPDLSDRVVVNAGFGVVTTLSRSSLTGLPSMMARYRVANKLTSVVNAINRGRRYSVVKEEA